MTRRRIVSIWFPHLAMDRWRKIHGDSDEALALIAEDPHGPRLATVNRKARESGVGTGQKLADARAIHPALRTEAADPAGDADWLGRLALWARRWCPWTAIDGTDALLLNIGGAAHLFGGEAAMLADMRNRLAALGFETRIALAPTIGGAWALAHFAAPEIACCPQHGLPEALAGLPVESLRLEAETTVLLRRLGLKTVGALATVPRLSLARRFRRAEPASANPLIRLDQALGRSLETVAPLAAEPVLRATRRVAEPVLHVAILAPILAALADALCAQLARRHRGVRRVRFEAFRVDGHVAALEAATAQPVRDPGHLARLFDERLGTLDAGFGFDAFVLTAQAHEPLAPDQAMLDAPARSGIALADLVDRLVARIGARNVCRPLPRASHVPERAVGWRSALAGRPPGVIDLPPYERPLRLFDRPEPITMIYGTPEGPPRRFRWRRRLHEVVKIEGPERIAPEWWRERSTVRLRDYYKIEDEAGRRFWIYRDGLAGDGRGGAPGWFLHGLFG